MVCSLRDIHMTQHTKIDLQIVQVMIGWKCNLSCQDCFSGVDILRNKIDHEPEVNDIIKSIDDLSNYVNNVTNLFTVSGGEPMLYWDKVKPVVRHIRKKFPLAKIMINSNGRLLHKHKDDLIDFLKEIQNISIGLANHASEFPDDPVGQAYHNDLDKFFSDSRLNKNHPMHYDIPDNDVNFHWNIWPDGFTAQWKRVGDKIKPFATKNPRKSMEHGCIGDVCAMLSDDSKLYKCARLAVLPTILKRIGQLDDPDWQPYLSYQPVDVSDNNAWADIYKFAEEEGKPISECDMCPDNKVIGISRIPHTKENIFTKGKQ